MALIKCIECGKMVSSRANYCPNCGCPIEDSLRALGVEDPTLPEYKEWNECKEEEVLIAFPDDGVASKGAVEPEPEPESEPEPQRRPFSRKKIVLIASIVLVLLAVTGTLLGVLLPRRGGVDSRSTTLNKYHQSSLSYEVTANANLSEGGTVTQSVTNAVVGQSVTLTALPSEGYAFAGWYDGDTLISTDPSYTFSMPDGGVNYTAKYELAVYTITTSTNLQGAGTYTAYDQEQCDSGESITLTATVNEGYLFSGWYDGYMQLSASLSYTFSMPSRSIHFIAQYIKNSYDLTADISLSGAGTVSTNGRKIVYGETARMTATVNTGYSFTGWYDGETRVSEKMTYTFPMPAKAVSYTAKYAKRSYSLNATLGLEGAGTVTPSSTEVVYGEDATLIATENEGYTFSGWYDGNTLISTDLSYTFSMPAKAVTYTAKYGRVIYTLAEDEQSYRVTGYLGTPLRLTIADTYRGKPVTGIGNEAFNGCTGITSITIGNNVTAISSSAFRGCSGLTSVTIPDGVTNIGGYAFEGCYGLTSVTIGNSVTSIGNNAFRDCSRLTSVTIGNSVTSIGGYAFEGCSALTSVTIPDSVRSIGYEAFHVCSRLTSVTIGNSVTSIGSSAFSGCSALKDIYYTGDVAGWCAISGLDGLMCYGKSEKALYIGGTKAVDLVISDSVTSIGNSAFYGCRGLTSVTIGNGVTSIGGSAFCDCYSLAEIRYKGTREEWLAITKESNWNFSAGATTKEGTYTVTYLSK